MVPSGWEKRELQGLIKIKHGFAFKSDFFTNTGEFVLLTPGSFNEAGGFREQGEKTKYYVGDVPEGYLLKKGDMLIAMTEQAEGLLGSALIVPENNKFLHNQRLGLVQVTQPDRVCLDYLYLFFNAPSSRRQISEQSTGTKVKHTSPDRLCSVMGLIPPLPEQKKIAQIISTWDKAIITTEQLIANSQDQKKALMQQLLTGNKRLSGKNGIRFNGEWKDHYLTDIAQVIVSPVDKKSVGNELPVELCNYTDVYYNNRITRGLNFMKATAKPAEIEKYTLQINDVIITKDSETPGDIAVPALVSEELGGVVCGYHLAIVRPDSKHLSGQYLSYLFSMPKTRYYFFTLATGATRFGLSVGGINKAHFKLPPLDEQQKIANVLFTADQKITTQQQKLNSLKQEKKSLMQHLLTGKRRVKIDNKEVV